MSDLLPQLQPQANYIVKKGQMYCVSFVDGIYVYCMLLGCQNFCSLQSKSSFFCCLLLFAIVVMDELKHKIALMNKMNSCFVFQWLKDDFVFEGRNQLVSVGSVS